MLRWWKRFEAFAERGSDDPRYSYSRTPFERAAFLLYAAMILAALPAIMAVHFYRWLRRVLGV